jgi:large subunit ribosomal protein L22
MEAKAMAKFVRISPRKVRQVAYLISKKNVNEALSILKFTPKQGARILEKVLKSAVANATSREENKNLDVDDLFMKSICINCGPTMKRFRARARGRASRILKRTSHVSIIISNEVKAGKLN